ncbi:hypothetical protein [Niveibacterium sp.]|uniref:hypothetical protein n=1 Tax=Niveibacterium sp. TaxID=2017444 RepID=UPI0035AE20EA
MKRHLLLAAMAVSLAAPVCARDTELHLPIQDAMNRADAQAKLNDGVKFYFGKQKYGKVDKSFGDDVSNTKTNAFNKSDEEACYWTFLSAMIKLQEKAKKLGADAVVDIESHTKGDPFFCAPGFSCLAGGRRGGVGLRGRFVMVI